MVLSSAQYDFAISSVTFSISALYPGSGILVIPGKSISVRSGQSEENIVITIGSGLMSI